MSYKCASIITIGDELLIGQVIDTNSAWIAQELNKIGIHVKHRISIGDIWDDIWQALDDEQRISDIVIITGGLGPTADDITKPLLCKYFNGKPVIHQETLQHVTHYFEKIRNLPLTERNRKQAEVPDVCMVLRNDVGTAPGMMFEKNGKVFISLPGVPYEMKWLMSNHVITALSERFCNGSLLHRTLLTAGIGESFLADRIQSFEESLPANIKLAYLPNHGMVRLRLTATETNNNTVKVELEQQFIILQSLLKDVIVVNEDITLQEAVGKVLLSLGETIATAESCTGGYISHLLTSISGSSSYFMGSVVSYDNSVKRDVLGVQEEILQTNGAVSEATVIQMAKGVCELMKVNHSIAVSGIMGPGGGTIEKPVGTVWIALYSNGNITTKKMQLRYDRAKNIEITAASALLLFLQNNKLPSSS